MLNSEERKPLFCVNENILGYRRKYIWGTTPEAVQLFSRLLNYGIYIDGFANDADAGMEIFCKPVCMVRDIISEDTVFLTADDRVSTNEFNIYSDVFLVNPSLNTEYVVVWGAGEAGKSVAKELKNRGIQVQFFLDSDVNKIGTFIDDIPIYGKDYILTMPKESSVIMAGAKCQEMCNTFLEYRQDITCFLQYSSLMTYENILLDDGTQQIHLDMLYNIQQICFGLSHKDIYVYGKSGMASKVIELLKLLNLEVKGYLIDSSYIDVANNNAYETKSVEDILYEDNFFVLITDSSIRWAEKLKQLGLVYCKDFSFVEKYRLDYFWARENILDINLGYTFASKTFFPGIEVIGKNREDDYKIGILGGSTTDQTLYSFRSWPDFLHDKHKEKLTIYNGGVTGYTSTQELLKLMRDILNLKPHMIIVYDGFNDARIPVNKRFKFSYLNKIAEFANNYMEKDTFLSSGGESKLQPWDGIESEGAGCENWLKNIEIMHFIANQNGINFFAFLQPMLGSKLNRDKSEDAILKMEGYDLNLIEEIQSFRKLGSIFSKRYDYIYDLSSIFDNKQGIYIDECHVWEEGNRIIAEEIWCKIKNYL